MSDTTVTKQQEQGYDMQDAMGLLRSYIAHRAFLAEAVGFVCAELDRRVIVHDLSKLRQQYIGRIKARGVF